MINNYKDFVRLNEEQEFGSSKAAKGIGGMLKNIFGSILKDVDDELKKPVEELNKKLGNQKNTKDMITTVNKHLLNHREALVTSMGEAKTLPVLVKLVEDNIRTSYLSIESSIKNFGDGKYTFEEIFKDAPERTKKLFDKNEKQFDKKVGAFSQDLVLSLGKPYKVTKEDLEKTPEAANDEQQKGEIAKAQGEAQTSDEVVENVENIDELKNDIQGWFDKTIYRTTKDSLETVNEEGEKPSEATDITSEIDNIPDTVTRNKDSVKSIASKLADTDKQTLIKVRDTLGLDKNDTPL